jgi:hypothetical protein
MTRIHLLISINRAEMAGLHYYAAALRELYRREFGERI